MRNLSLPFHIFSCSSKTSQIPIHLSKYEKPNHAAEISPSSARVLSHHPIRALVTVTFCVLTLQNYY
eukprot:m.60508 g.60508  ORF g.60508 m.60508 type:complete len:67 (-) comp9508_c0_seq1:2564-2764(-)